MLKGSAELEHAGKRSPLKVGDRFESGDSIITGTDGVAVVALRGNAALAEIQPSTTFRLQATEKSTEVGIDAGRVWLNVAKRSADEEFKVRTPTALAGVRGTKFLTAQFGDTTAICHCEGDVEYSSGEKYKATHHTDTLVLSRGGKTVTLTPDDLVGVHYNHNHSMMDNSPLGAKDDLPPEVRKKILDMAEKKFKELN